MPNGVAYVLDESRELPKRVNPELVGLAQVTGGAAHRSVPPGGVR